MVTSRRRGDSRPHEYASRTGGLTPFAAFAVFLTAMYATAPLALYLECARPCLRWYRARPHTHVALAVLALMPVAVLATDWDSSAAGVLASVGTAAVLVAFFLPESVVRVSGGPAPLDAELRVITEQLLSAGRLVDVGDLTGASAHVAEARRATTDRAREYINHWDEFIREERMRRRGVRVSRAERLAAMSEIHRQLVLGRDPIPRATSVISIAVVAAVSLVSASLGAA